MIISLFVIQFNRTKTELQYIYRYLSLTNRTKRILPADNLSRYLLIK